MCALCRIASDSGASTALQWRPVSLLDRGVKIHANERTFREVEDRQYAASRCFVLRSFGATPWEHYALLRPVHEVSFAS